MTKLFGTDGIRAEAGEYPLDYSSVYTLGSALVRLLKEEGYTPQILIGRDTRESGIWLEHALTHGIRDAGGEAVSTGVIPTSAVSYLTMDYSISAGVMISASHNPYHDNGIKIFSSQGMKISEEWESRLESAIQSSQKKISPVEIPIAPAGSLRKVYKDFLTSRFNPPQDFLSKKVIGLKAVWVSEIPKDAQSLILHLQRTNTVYKKLDRTVLLAILAAKKAFKSSDYLDKNIGVNNFKEFLNTNIIRYPKEKTCPITGNIAAELSP